MNMTDMVVRPAGCLFLALALGTWAGCGSTRSTRNLTHLLAQAQEGNPQAEFELAEIYDNGDGVPRNEAEAFRWYRAAAEAGHGEAQYILGLMYKDGRVAHKDFVQAYKWLSLSAARGNATAPAALDSIARRMNRDQTAQAQSQAAAFVPRQGPPSLQPPPATKPQSGSPNTASPPAKSPDAQPFPP